jgi:HK97 family phage major capsid protein
MTDLSEDIIRTVLGAMYAIHPRDRMIRRWQWVMTLEMYREAQKAVSSDGRPLWVPTPGAREHLLGWPVEIRDGAIGITAEEVTQA